MAQNPGKLELILGCMFSGKSSELIRRIRQHRLLGRNIMVVNNALDVRYGTGLKITSHDMAEEHAVACKKLEQVFDHPEYARAHTVFVDEGQFFSDLREFVLRAIEMDGKSVVVSALDGNYKREPFMNVISLIPFAEDVTRLNALCVMCKDGTPASFSKRLVSCVVGDIEQGSNVCDIVNDRTNVLVGGADMYMSVCRKHYNA